MELRKRPGVYATLSLTFRVGDTLSNIRQVLKNDRTAIRGVLDDALGEDVIVISSLPKQFTTQLFQMPFRRFGAFGLKLTTEMEDATFLFFPPTISQEAAIRGNSGSVETQINPTITSLEGSTTGAGRETTIWRK